MHIGNAISIVIGEIRTKLIQFGTKYRKKFGFGFITSTDIFLSYQILEEVKTALSYIVQARYDKSFIVELEIASREEFILIERRLTRLWERLARHKIQETPKETEEIVQNLMQDEDLVPADSSDEVVSIEHNASMLTFDLNKTPEENEIF
ncbi:hypothetical protein Ahy_B03g061939 [Arachis hypogaea]|uniref:Oxo-4-hydroxy-4-carboxy-5-ureidoimidazoline decarboxylase domain-containing protein n=1 Tax=Arachis hypogaea TaxID=3818 RepID=A0A444ZSH7_ARAHY|nr:hypothetical protein Ahy_B03g061939 [Arachis hypogaea]